jgi:hypothetical protein
MTKSPVDAMVIDKVDKPGENQPAVSDIPIPIAAQGCNDWS